MWLNGIPAVIQTHNMGSLLETEISCQTERRGREGKRDGEKDFLLIASLTL